LLTVCATEIKSAMIFSPLSKSTHAPWVACICI